MKYGIKLESIWEDEDLFEVRISATNSKFSAVANCYTLRSEILQLANLLTGFPKSHDQEVSFSTGSNDTQSYFSLNFKTVDRVGHIVVRMVVSHIETYSNAAQEKYYSEFDIQVEPASIDRFISSLRKLAETEIGEEEAVLN